MKSLNLILVLEAKDQIKGYGIEMESANFLRAFMAPWGMEREKGPNIMSKA